MTLIHVLTAGAAGRLFWNFHINRIRVMPERLKYRSRLEGFPVVWPGRNDELSPLRRQNGWDVARCKQTWQAIVQEIVSKSFAPNNNDKIKTLVQHNHSPIQLLKTFVVRAETWAQGRQFWLE